MGSCLSSVEVIAVAELKSVIIPAITALVLEEARTKIIPEVIEQLKVAEAQINAIVISEN